MKAKKRMGTTAALMWRSRPKRTKISDRPKKSVSRSVIVVASLMTE